MRAFFIKYRILLAFTAVFIAFLYVGNQNRNLALDNKSISAKIQQQVVDTRASQYKGCLRTNARTDETNKVFNSLYSVALGAANASEDSRASDFVQTQKDKFSGLTKTDCAKEYPSLTKQTAK